MTLNAMRRSLRRDPDYGKRGREAQEWGLALLFSVPPTDRALAYWAGAGSTSMLLEMLAEGRGEDYCTDRTDGDQAESI